MKNKPNAERLWKQLEDVIVPRLRLSVLERAVYSHLLRHSRLEGKLSYRFSIASLSRTTRISAHPVRLAVRRLVDCGVLRLLTRTKAGHVVEVRLPDEVRVARFNPPDSAGLPRLPHPSSLEQVDFMQTKALRKAIHLRERGLCFYCLRRLPVTVRCLDHVVPRAQSGRNSYRNLVSVCLECNCHKGDRSAEDFLRWLYRQRRLTDAELNGRLRALTALAAGKLRPARLPIPGRDPVRAQRKHAPSF